LNAKFGSRRASVSEFRDLIATLEKATALDPRYTLAYVALAENYNLLGTFLGQAPAYNQAKAKQTLQRALSMDDSLSEAHGLLAKIKMDFDHDWTGSEREFRRAIELNPSNEQAHHWYGEVYLSAMKRLDESIAELETARRLNPLSSGILTGLAWSYIGKGEYLKAIEECNKAFEVNPDDTGIYEYRGKAYFKLSRFDEAIADAKKSLELDPTARYLATLAVFYAFAGRQSEARDAFRRMQADKTIGDVSNYDFAIVYGALGDRDEAFRRLNEEAKSKSVDLLSIRIDPLLDELRDDPRFIELEKKFDFDR
jgi:tetratricopeptide (TPR) repeat protein